MLNFTGRAPLAARAGLLALAASLPAAPAFAQQGGKGPATKVIVAPAKEAQLVSRVEALGTLRANDRVDITAPVTERIEIIHVTDGARVEKGALLVELNHQQEDAMLEEALATRDEAREQLENAERLFNSGTGSQTSLTQRRRDAAVAQARVRAAEAQIEDRVLTAPFPGRIGISNASAGATVEPGDLIMRLIDDSVLKLDFSVPNTVLADLRVGAEIEARARAFPGEVFRGAIRTIDAEADPVTRSVLVRAFIPNKDGRLLPGLLMEVDLLLNARSSLVVDEESLIPFGEDTFVLLIVEKDGKPHVERRKVKTGLRRVGTVEILEGLAAGDLVVVEGALKVRPGQPVSPVHARPEPSGEKASQVRGASRSDG